MNSTGGYIVEQSETKRFCIHCGNPMDDGDAFCMHCGAKAEPLEPALEPVPEPDPEVPENPVCKACGAAITPDDLFCMNCGAKLPGQSEDMPPKQPVEEPRWKNMANAGQTPGTASAFMKFKRPLLIAGAAVLLLVIIAVAYLLGHRGSSASSANTDTTPEIPAIIQDAGDGDSLPVDTDEGSTDIDSTEDANRVTNTDDANNPENTDNTGNTSADDQQDSQAANPPEAPGVSSEPVENTGGTTDLSDLYIGAWIAEGQSEGDEQNGWTALYLNSAADNSMTFSLEKIQSAPASRMASTDPITVTLEDGKGTFPVSDSWGNSGTGEITVRDGVIHVKVSITDPDPMSLWDISMDTDLYPEVDPAGSAGTTV